MKRCLFILLSLVMAAGLLVAQPVAVAPGVNQTVSSRWGTNVQITDRSVYAFDVDYRANGEMCLCYITGQTQHDSLFICRSVDGGLTWIPWEYFSVTGDERRFTDVNVICGDTLLYIFMPADTADGVYRDFMMRSKYDLSALVWRHFAAGTAAGIIDKVDADRSGLPGDTMNIFYHTVSNGMSLVYSHDNGSTWHTGENLSGCSSPSITWIKDNRWAAAYRFDPAKITALTVSNNNGQSWFWGGTIDTSDQDTLNTSPSITACHGTGQIMVATCWNTADVSWLKDIKVYCATNAADTQFVNNFGYQFSGDQALPVVNCLRFGGNDWGNLAYCDYGFSGDSVRYAYNYQGGAFSFPAVVSDRPGAGAATPLQPKIAYCNDGGHTGPAIFYAGAGRQGIYMDAGWVTGVTGGPVAGLLSGGSLGLETAGPNPFSSLTAVSYQLPAPGNAVLAVYNMAGQRVRTLVNARQAAGAHTARWDGRSDSGQRVAGGVYLVRLQTGAGSITRKLALVK